MSDLDNHTHTFVFNDEVKEERCTICGTHKHVFEYRVSPDGYYCNHCGLGLGEDIQ